MAVVVVASSNSSGSMAPSEQQRGDGISKSSGSIVNKWPVKHSSTNKQWQKSKSKNQYIKQQSTIVNGDGKDRASHNTFGSDIVL